MKSWKIINKITLGLSAIFFCIIIYFVFEALTYSGTYPYPTIAGDVNNWFDRFIINFWFCALIPFGIPGITSIVLYIVSIFKLKSSK